MEELRIDLSKCTDEEINAGIKEVQNLHVFNQTMPYTKEYTENLNKLFKNYGENLNLRTPLQGVRFNNVKIGKTFL